MGYQERWMIMIRRKKYLPRAIHWALAAIFGITIFVLVMTITFTEV
jgi:hypothetical protein